MFFYLSGISSYTVCLSNGSADGGAGGGWNIGGGGVGGCAWRVAIAFTFFGGATEAMPTVPYVCLDDGAFFLGGARALLGACAATAEGSVARNGMKRARTAAILLPMSAPPLGFGAWGGGKTEAAAAAVAGGTE